VVFNHPTIVRIFNRSTLRDFWEKHADAAGPLHAWFEEAESALWKGPQDIRERFGSADFVGGDRVVFNIGGNKYRLIVHVVYKFHAVYIRFVGTHAEYDKVDAATV
jgi:mRNA interferase HigB